MLDPEALADRLFSLSAGQQWDAMAAMFADDAVVQQPGSGPNDVATTLAAFRRVTGRGITVSYEHVRRIVGDGALVEQHDVRMTRPDGVHVVLDVCAVLRFDEHGAITRLDEYFDPAATAPLFARS